MRQLLPHAEPVENVTELLAGDDRPTPAGRPWVMANMVMSADGAWAREGRSGGLSGPGDKAVFFALRAICDVVLVAAGTARAERYRRPWPPQDAGDLRRHRGQAPAPRLVLVSRSLAVPADQPFLEGDGPPPLVLHPTGADATALPAGLEHRAAGDHDRVDLAAALGSLADDGHRLVLCEGGPGLLGQMVAAGLVDEFFLTLSPTLAGGGDVGLLGATGPVDADLGLHRVLEDDGFLLLTYRRAGTAGTDG